MLTFENNARVAGTITNDPVIRKVTTAGGEFSILDLTLAVNPDTSRDDIPADFVRVNLFGGLADTVAQYTKKGESIGVVGSLSTGSGPYKDKNGVQQYPVHIDVDTVDFSRDFYLNFNDQVLVGNLTNDPETTTTKNGKTVTRFTIGVNRPKKRNEKESKSDFFQIVTFDKQAEFVQKHFSKGKRIFVQGRINTGSFENEQGFRVYTTQIVASRVKFVKKKNTSNQQNNYQAPNPQQNPQNNYNNYPPQQGYDYNQGQGNYQQPTQQNYQQAQQDYNNYPPQQGGNYNQGQNNYQNMSQNGYGNNQNVYQQDSEDKLPF